MSLTCTVGDVVAYRPHGGGERVVVVTGRDDEMGEPCFDGTLLDTNPVSVWGYDRQIHQVLGRARFATVDGQAARIDAILRYMPANYTAVVNGEQVQIMGFDRAGWTLDGYVIPRLASGLIFAVEVQS